MYDFSGKTVLVTGGTSGIGATAANGYAKNGARVYVLARSTGSFPKRENISIIMGDVTNTSTRKSVIDKVTSETGRLDILINAAANRPERINLPIEELCMHHLQNAIDVHLNSVFALTLAVWPIMKAQNFGRIVNFSSGHIFGSRQDHGMIPFSIAKAGIVGLTRAFAQAAKLDGIAINAIFPAAMDGQWNRSEWRTPSDEEEIMLHEICNADALWPLISYLTSTNASPCFGQLFSQCNNITTRVMLADGENFEYNNDLDFEEFMQSVIASQPHDCPPNIGSFFSKHLGIDRTRSLAAILPKLKNTISKF